MTPSLKTWIVEKAGHHRVLGLWSFGVAAAYVPFIPSGSIYGRWAIAALGAAVLIWTARVVPSAAHWLFAGLLAWITCGFLWTTSGWETAYELMIWSILAAVFCVAFTLDDIAPIWTGFCLGIVVSCGFAIAQTAGYDSVWSVHALGATGLFVTKNMAMEAAVIAAVGACARSRWALLPAAIVAVILVGGRGALLALMAVAVFASWTMLPRYRPAVTLATLITIMLIGYAASAGLLGTINDRVEIWTLIARNLSVLGDGAGTLPVAATWVEIAHNEFLHYGFELGIGSLFLWGIFVHALRSGPVLERCALVAILALCLVWAPLHSPASAFMAVVLAGHLCGRRYRAGVVERDRRVVGISSLLDGEALGIGAMCAAGYRTVRGVRRGGADLSPATPGGELVSD